MIIKGGSPLIGGERGVKNHTALTLAVIKNSKI